MIALAAASLGACSTVGLSANEKAAILTGAVAGGALGAGVGALPGAAAGAIIGGVAGDGIAQAVDARQKPKP